MLKKFLVTASVAGLMAGAASALEVDAVTVAAAVGNPTPLAAELDYAGGAVATSGAHNQLRFAFYPTGGTFPTGNVVIRIVVSGAEFSAGLTGAEVTTPAPGTSVVSSGGISGGTEVNFLLSDVSACDNTPNCYVDLPLELGSGNVSVQVGMQTDAGVPIDNSSLTNLKTETLAIQVPAFDANIVADTTDSEATLASLFTALTNNALGTIEVLPNLVNVGSVAVPDNVVAQRDLLGNAVDAGGTDVASIGLLVEGFMDAFDPVAPPAGGAFSIGALPVTVDSADDEATASAAISTVYPVTVTPDGTTALQRSDYDVSVVVNVTPTSPLTSGATFTGSLESITREGTEVTFPWTQTATQGDASGATSVFRIGNLDSSDTGAVFVEVRNASEAGFTNPGIVELAPSIDGNGEFVINSAALETAVGNYGRGDVNFIVEADSSTLTGRQFVVRNGVIQQVIGGTIFQDQN